MRKLFILALAAAAAVGCAKDEVLDFNKEAIGFQNAFINNATRAIDPSITTATLTGFNVYGTTQGDETGAPIVPIFTYAEVTGTPNVAESWNLTNTNNTQYWIPGNKYNFAAVVNAQQGNITLGGDKLPQTIKYVADYATDGNTPDLLYARPDQIVGQPAGSNSRVAFSFSHLLSKVHFTLKNDIATNVEGNMYTYQLSNITINNAYDEATCTVASKAWDTTLGTANETVEFGGTVVVGKEDETDKATSEFARLIIPANYDSTNELSITYTITTFLNGQKVNVETPTVTIEQEFLAGQAYNFQISKGNPGDPIQFSVTAVNGWENGNTEDDDNDGVNDNVPLS